MKEVRIHRQNVRHFRPTEASAAEEIQLGLEIDLGLHRQHLRILGDGRSDLFTGKVIIFEDLKDIVGLLGVFELDLLGDGKGGF